ncbi:MAG: permease-like cell division protein FtsX [Nitrospira sp.]|nr:ABC transporter permease [Candidatus Manganitrophaceae bacterium]HIL34559.1 ABC transporter permease [Candidatus Manganitrophaceae bacterium]
MKRLLYFFDAALENIKLNRTMALLSLISLSLTLMLFGLFLLFYYNFQGFIGTMRENVQFSIYINNAIGDGKIKKIEEALSDDDRIASFDYISKEKALELFKAYFQDQPLLKSLGENPLPASFEIRVKANHQDPVEIQNMIKYFKSLPGVDEIHYGSELFQTLNAFLNFMKIVGLGIGGFLAVAVMTIVANTIRLHFYNRREEIEIMKLIGATHRFIKIPFFMEGSMMGLVGGGLATLILFSLYSFSKVHLQSLGGVIGHFQDIRFLPVSMLVGLIVAGGMFGGIGSLVSLNQLLRLQAKSEPQKK